jgi:hypothetical protein
MFGFAMDRMTQMRSTPVPASFCDIDYVQLVTDPIGVVRRVYDHAGMDLAEDVEGRMRQYVRRNPQHKQGVHRYSPEQYGLSRGDVQESSERYSGWLERFARL